MDLIARKTAVEAKSLAVGSASGGEYYLTLAAAIADNALVVGKAFITDDASGPHPGVMWRFQKTNVAPYYAALRQAVKGTDIGYPDDPANLPIGGATQASLDTKAGVDQVNTGLQANREIALADRRAPTRYTVYDPGTTWVTAFNGETDGSGYIYSHDSAICAFDGGYVLLWNAGTSAYEGASPQAIVEKHATTAAGLAGAAITAPFSAQQTSDGTQWQPGMIAAEGELWALWTQIGGANQGTYWSRKTSLAGAWTTATLAVAPLTKNGITYEVCYITGDPVAITLDDGTVRHLCPAAFESQTSYTPIASMPNSSMSGNFTRCAKMAGVLIMDQGDATWRVGGMVADPVYPWLTWEPAISRDASGTLRLRLRSMNHFAGALTMMVETVSYDDGESFGPLVPMDMHAGQTRNAHRIGDAANGSPPLLIGNDCYIAQPGMAFSPAGRRSLALYVGNGDRDMIPGAVISDDNVDRTGCYPSLTETADSLVISYSCTLRSPQNFANTIRVATIAKPTGAQIMIRGNGNDYKSPVFVAAGGGEWAHFAYHPQTTLLTTATLSSLGISATAQTVVLIGKLTDRGGIYDCRAGGQTGYGIRTHGTLQLDFYHPTLDPTYNIYPGVTIDTGLAVPLDEEIMIALAIDGTGQSVTAYVVHKNGTVDTATVAISLSGTTFTPRTMAPAATAYMGSARDDSALAAARQKMRCEKVFGSVLTANNLRYVHGQHAAALGMTAWAGTATDPGAAAVDLDATDVHAGTNDGTWTAKFGKTGLTDGSATVTTHSGREALLLTGQRSASLVPPLTGRLPNHWTFEYESAASRSAETTLCTLGDARNNIRMVKTAAGAVVARETVESTTRADITITAASSDGDPHRVTVVLGNGTVTLTESGNKLTLPYDGRNILFLGKAWGLNTTDTNNGCYFFVDSVASKNAVVNEADYLPPMRWRRYGDNTVEGLNRFGGPMKFGAVTVLASGNVGFNQTAPTSPFHVTITSATSARIDGSGSPVLPFYSTSTSGTFQGPSFNLYAGNITAGNSMGGVSLQATNGGAGSGVFSVGRRKSDGTSAGNLILYDDAAPYFRFYLGDGVTTATSTLKFQIGPTSVEPGGDATSSLGLSSKRYTTVYAATGSINTSDAREKQQIGDVPDEWLDAWGAVRWVRYKFNDAVAAKGDAARWHLGGVAQEVRDAFTAAGLDATAIGLCCYDEWPDHFEPVLEDEIIPAVLDDDGNELEPARIEVRKLLEPVLIPAVLNDEGEEIEPERTELREKLYLAIPAGNRWGLRYDECFAIEVAWQRREMARMGARLAALESA